MKDKRMSLYLAALAAILAPILPTLPDTATGSPRAILTGLETGLLAAAVLLRGRDRAASAP